MSQTYLTTEELSHRIKYDTRTIRDRLKDRVLLEGRHYFRPFGGRKILYIWEAIERDMRTRKIRCLFRWQTEVSAMASIRTRKDNECLFLDFYYRGKRCREQTALESTSANRKRLEKILNKIEEEIRLGTFDYARYFPSSRNVARCVFHTKLDTDSAANWTVIPAQTGHAFRGKLDS